MALATPELVVTNIGEAVASTANPEGPFIHIVGFRIGSAYGYTPDASQTALQGADLYDGAVTSWNSIGNNTLDIVLTIPPDAGPFQFGEVGLYLADANGQFSASSALFAIGVFDDPQTKYSSLGTNVISSYTFHCLLRLQQSVAVFQIDTSGVPPAVVNVYQWSDVYPPGISANPDVPLLLVHELSARGDSSLLLNSTDAYWTLGSSSYHIYSPARTGSTGNGTFFNVVNASSTWIEVLASDCHPFDLGNFNRQFVIETEDGFFRSVSSVVANGANYRFNLNTTNDGTYNNSPLPNVPPVNSQIRIYRSDQAGGSIYYDQIVDPPSIPIATVGNPGLAYGGTGTYMNPANPGAISAYGLLQSPSTNTGRYLTSSDDMNYTKWASGWYTVSTGVFGQPANTPISGDGHMFIMSEDPASQTNGNSSAISVCQIFYPAANGGGDPNGVGGAPPYWREWNATVVNSQGGWSNWFAFSVQGKNGAGNSFAAQDTNPTGGTAQNLQALVPIPGAGTWSVLGWGKGMVNQYQGAQLLINGVVVDTTGAYGDTDGIGFNTMWGTQKITVTGPTTIQVVMLTTNISGALGDFRVLGLAVPTSS